RTRARSPVAAGLGGVVRPPPPLHQRGAVDTFPAKLSTSPCRQDQHHRGGGLPRRDRGRPFEGQARSASTGRPIPFNSTSPTFTNLTRASWTARSTRSLTSTSPGPARAAISAAVFTVLPK